MNLEYIFAKNVIIFYALSVKFTLKYNFKMAYEKKELFVKTMLIN